MILNPCKFKLTRTVLSSFSPIMRITKAKHAVLQVLRKKTREIQWVPHVKVEFLLENSPNLGQLQLSFEEKVCCILAMNTKLNENPNN